MDEQRRAYAFGVGAVLCWSTVASAFKLSLGYLSPGQLVLLASATSWLFLGALLVFSGRLHLVAGALRGNFLRSACLGALNPVLYYLILFQAYARLPAQEAQALNYTWALTMALLAVPLRGHRLRGGELAAAVICYLGVLVIATRGRLASLEFADPAGVGLALASTLIWACYWLLGAGDRRDPVASLFLNFSFAQPLLFAWCLYSGELGPMPWQGILGGVYVGLVEMGISFVLWLLAMRLTRSTLRISSLIFLAPPLSLVLLHFVVGEPVLPSTLLGLGLILAGLALQYRRRA